MTRRVLVSIAGPLLDRIDAACRDRGLSRSRYLAQLAEVDLQARRGPGADPAARSALARIDRLFARPTDR